MLADRVQGRKIRQVLEIRLEPLEPVRLAGDPGSAMDVAIEVGEGLIMEAMRVLQAAAEREGFKVTIGLGQISY